jgi:hypothetical protein
MTGDATAMSHRSSGSVERDSACDQVRAVVFEVSVRSVALFFSGLSGAAVGHGGAGALWVLVFVQTGLGQGFDWDLSERAAGTECRALDWCFCRADRLVRVGYTEEFVVARVEKNLQYVRTSIIVRGSKALARVMFTLRHLIGAGGRRRCTSS